MNPNVIESGKLIARILSGAWRNSPLPLAIGENELDSVRSNILKSASAGLVWWRIRNSGLRASDIGLEMQNAFRFYGARAIAHERDLSLLLDIFHSHKIEPLLAKGWAVARSYPNPALRPYGDFDLCIRVGTMAKLPALQNMLKKANFTIDLHERFRELESGYDELLERSQRIAIGRDYVRVLAAEDHLRLLCIHALYHGVWKPGWLCDVALAVESSSPEFNWEHCLAGDERRTEWVLAAIALSHRVLGADLPSAVRYLQDRKLPGWAYDAVYSQWGRNGNYMQGPSASALVKTGRILDTLRSRWPNPLQATVRTRARVNDAPRLPYQIADVLLRGAKLLKGNGTRRWFS